MAVKVNIVNMPSPKNSGPRPRTQLGVLHSAECPLKRGYPMSLTEWSINSTVVASWTEFVGPGVVVQSVHSDYIAWHASVANKMSWGTEQTGYAAYSRAQWLTKDGRDQLERLAMQWASNAKYHGWKLSDLRWLTTAKVRDIIAERDTHTKGFCTHAQIDPASRSDPGPNYPYGLLMQRTRAHFTSTSTQANAPQELEWSDMATENQVEDAGYRGAKRAIRELLGDVVDVPNNQGSAQSRENNPTWTVSNALTNIWHAANEAANVLDKPVDLKGDTEGTTTARTKIAWLAHEQHRTVDAIEKLTAALQLEPEQAEPTEQ